MYVFKNDSDSQDLSNRIFGGSTLKITDAPFMAEYVSWMDEEYRCGACIVHERFLITAAHCYFPNYNNYVQVGSDHYNGGKKYSVQEVVIHPEYMMYTDYNNDIAVIILKTKLVLNERVNIIKMATKDSVVMPGEIMTTMGFGMTEDFDTSNKLLIVKVPYVGHSECRSKIDMTITASMICAGGVVGQDSCKGDSGGPLVYKGLLYGIVSFGRSCGLPIPGVYASIPALRDFVDQTIKNKTSTDMSIKKINRPWRVIKS
ncbi:trypsin alpha-3-like [Melitaea cinxia]|uniref:trypsin alpha-3-like n=1 Tax=Melitaea cinxia TaxID=113334 RepID=UPI001E27259D|nr:trypsin alpha-3-like [Melitaea cinxia]